MNVVGTIYGLYHKNPHLTIVPNTDWWQAELGKSWCGRCTGLRRELYPQPIDVQVTHVPPKYPIGLTSRLAVGIIRADIRAMLEPWLDRFVFGRCFGSEGEPLDTHSTFYSAHFVYDRFGSGTHYRQCSMCGLVWPRDVVSPRYFVQRDLVGRDVLQTKTCSTLVSERVLQVLDVRSVPDLKVKAYPVLEAPIDGVRLLTDPPEAEGESPDMT